MEQISLTKDGDLFYYMTSLASAREVILQRV